MTGLGIAVLGLVYLAVTQDSWLCGWGAFFLFLELCDRS